MLSHLSDHDLVSKLKEKVKAERQILVELLQHLEEVERRKLYLARGYSSIFAFCTEELGYSEGEAHARIQAMRLGRAVPEVTQKIAQGDLSLTVAAKAQGCFMRAIKSKQPLSKPQKIEILKNLCHSSTRQAEKILASHFPESALPKEVMKPVSSSLTRIEFNLNSNQLAKLEELKGLLAHRHFEGRLDGLFEAIADLALAKLRKEKPNAPSLEAPQVSRRQAPAVETGKRTRYLPIAIRRQVWARDQGHCQYQDPVTGRRCGSQHALELDHVQPYAQGGENHTENLRLLCSAHNKWRAMDT